MTGEPCFEVPARLGRLAEALAAVQRAGEGLGLSSGDQQRVRLLTEELFTNTVLHGHGGGSDAPVRLTLRREASAAVDAIELVYEDTAPPFDPTQAALGAQAALDVAAADRPEGQMGLPLILGLAAQVGYRRVAGWNRLRLVLLCRP